jgi:hypothetical protein
MQQWLFSWGLVLAALAAVSFGLSVWKAGFANAVEVMLGKSPLEVSGRWWNVPLGIASWLAVPALTGALVAYLVERRVRPWSDKEALDKQDEIFKKFDERLQELRGSE